MLFPIAWMILLSLKEYPDAIQGFFEKIKPPYSIINYKDALSSDSFDLYFYNSIIVALLVAIGNLLLCFTVGYALARRKFKLNKAIFLTIIGVLIIPPHVIMIPLYRLIVSFGWINSYYALIIPWLVTPFGIFLVKQYIESIPEELEDAARIDGASDLNVIFRIVFPVSKPILTVLFIYIFLTNWNSFLFPFLFTNDSAHRTLPVGLAFYLGKQSIDWGHLMAGASMSAMPVIILFLLFQKKIIKSLTAGALKG